MQLVLSWPVRLLIIGLLLFSLFVDGAGYWYRIANHYPLTGNVAGEWVVVRDAIPIPGPVDEQGEKEQPDDEQANRPAED